MILAIAGAGWGLAVGLGFLSVALWIQLTRGRA